MQTIDGLRILVTGSRDWDDVRKIEEELAFVALVNDESTNVTLVHGACPTGADAIADGFARRMGWDVETWPADWDRYGKRGAWIRNARMVKSGADICLAFIRNGSRGATGTAHLAEKAGITTIRFVVNDKATI